ncbi:MAG: response regulator transcription factor, partial [Acidimicrobiales bacterium]
MAVPPTSTDGGRGSMALVAEQLPTVVVVEDDRAIADLLELYLRGAGYDVVLAGDAEAGRQAVAAHAPDLVLLDVGLPGEADGFELCRQLRQRGSVPVILLTARDGEIDRVLGLELGADDYVVKPFSPRELVARVRAVLRRTGEVSSAPAVIRVGDVEVDAGRREIRVGGEPVALATREFSLLLHLAENQGLALSRRQLLDGAWGHDWYGDERTVDVHVRQLRKKLGDAL